MEQGLKERLVGAAVLVILAVIFIPMILGGAPETDQPITETNIPARPADEFSSRVVPIQTMQTKAIQTTTEGKKDTTGPADEHKQPTPLTTRQEDKSEIKKAAQSADEKKSKRVGLTAWVVQLGSFSSKENADSLNKKLRKAGYPAFIEPIKREGGTIYRVRVGPELLRSDAESLLEKLKSSMKLEGVVLRYP
ncbi:MAG: SPOR domain-containing protein [Gammaproteobacteria bacterium]